MPVKKRHGVKLLDDAVPVGGVSVLVDAESFTQGIFYVSTAGSGQQIVLQTRVSAIQPFAFDRELHASLPTGNTALLVTAPMARFMRLSVNGGAGDINVDAFEGVREIA